jgi:large subunit ribosomal protein L37Ae
MAEIVEKKFGSVKRFGPRYGKRIKDKIAKIEQKQKMPNKCPYCKKPTAERIAAGIWQCSKCRAKFAGGAYFIEEKIAKAVAEEKDKAIVLKSKKSEEVI